MLYMTQKKQFWKHSKETSFVESMSLSRLTEKIVFKQSCLKNNSKTTYNTTKTSAVICCALGIDSYSEKGIWWRLSQSPQTEKTETPRRWRSWCFKLEITRSRSRAMKNFKYLLNSYSNHSGNSLWVANFLRIC